MLKVLDIFFSTVKPAIPLCLYTTLLFSIKRLENKKIHTINKFKINQAGLVDIMCFDKTGTLTEEFPETFAYGVNSILDTGDLCQPMETLIFPEKAEKVGVYDVLAFVVGFGSDLRFFNIIFHPFSFSKSSN